MDETVPPAVTDRDEETEVFAPENGGGGKSQPNTFSIPIFLVLLVLVGTGAFFFGSRKNEVIAPSPSPTLGASPTTTASPSASPSASPTATPE